MSTIRMTQQPISLLLNDLIHDPSLLVRLNPVDFEHVVAAILSTRNYEIELHAGRRAHRPGDMTIWTADALDMDLRALVQCRQPRGGRPIGIGPVQDLYHAAMAQKDIAYALLVTSSHFTRAALDFASSNGRIILVSGQQLLGWALDANKSADVMAESLAYRLSHLEAGQEFGRLVSPSGRPLPSAENLADGLKIPASYVSNLITVDQVPLEVIRHITSDPTALHTLTPRQFEIFVAELVDKLGFEDVLLTPPSGDGGRDVIAKKRVHGIPITFYLECKKYAEGNAVQLDTLRALLGVVAHHSTSANIGVLVTTSRFTRGCTELIASECRLDGKDYGGVVDWTQEYRKARGWSPSPSLQRTLPGRSPG